MSWSASAFEPPEGGPCLIRGAASSSKRQAVGPRPSPPGTQHRSSVSFIRDAADGEDDLLQEAMELNGS
eukprot:6109361-Prymnesium_polylepis.1